MTIYKTEWQLDDYTSQLNKNLRGSGIFANWAADEEKNVRLDMNMNIADPLNPKELRTLGAAFVAIARATEDLEDVKLADENSVSEIKSEDIFDAIFESELTNIGTVVDIACKKKKDRDELYQAISRHCDSIADEINCRLGK